jgi:hypothetical protein
MRSSDQRIRRIDHCGKETLIFIELLWAPFDQKERPPTPTTTDRCFMSLVCDLREMWLLMGIMRGWLECHLSIHTRNGWSAIQKDIARL